jgi:hypothetical protein
MDAKKPKYPINFAIAKYGMENFKFEAICECKDRTELDFMEEFCIWAYSSNDSQHGYNIALGGNSKHSITDETRKKLSDALKGRPAHNKGKPISQIQRQRLKKISTKIPSKNPKRSSKLSWNDVTAIRAEYIEGTLTIKDIAIKYGVSKGSITNVISNRTWTI